MSPARHHSPVRFTDETTLLHIRDALVLKPQGSEKSHLVSEMFDRSRLRIGGLMNHLPQMPIVSLDSKRLLALQNELEASLVDTIRILAQTFDLSSKEWKNAPAIWEMLSFDQEVLHSAATPLPQALQSALTIMRPSLGDVVDIDELGEDLDEVIHQTAARRNVIEKTLIAAIGADISDTPLLHTDGIRETVIQGLRQGIQSELAAADFILAEAASEAICKACHPEEADDEKTSFALSHEQVTRVTGEEAMRSAVGDVYLVRSQNVKALGDHFIVITGGLVQKPHGLRPQDIPFPIPSGMQTPLEEYSLEEVLVLLKLDDAARLRFYEEFNVAPEFRRP